MTLFVKPGLYSSTDVANLYLAKGSAKSLHDMIIYQSQTIYPLWNNIADAVRSVENRKPVKRTKHRILLVKTNRCSLSCREGKNQYEKTFGLPSEDVFQAIYRLVLCKKVLLCG